ncbi:MAG TPA: GNAT family N-acetyltransferase [Chthoniobacterales bacterium]
MTKHWYLRLATEADISAIAELISLSVRTLQAGFYTTEQIEGALGGVFGVDGQLIVDGTYFIAESHGRIAGCGGWSKRQTLFGSDRDRIGDNPVLDPEKDAARIRAFFTHPDWARRGIATAILCECESAIRAAGFSRAEMGATLAGIPLYEARGYTRIEEIGVRLAGGRSLPIVRMGKSWVP